MEPIVDGLIGNLHPLDCIAITTLLHLKDTVKTTAREKRQERKNVVATEELRDPEGQRYAQDEETRARKEPSANEKWMNVVVVAVAKRDDCKAR
jgi:hypothetical protein